MQPDWIESDAKGFCRRKCRDKRSLRAKTCQTPDHRQLDLHLSLLLVQRNGQEWKVRESGTLGFTKALIDPDVSCVHSPPKIVEHDIGTRFIRWRCEVN